MTDERLAEISAKVYPGMGLTISEVREFREICAEIRRLRAEVESMRPGAEAWRLAALTAMLPPTPEETAEMVKELRRLRAEVELHNRWLAVATERRWGIVPWGVGKWSISSDGGTHLFISEQPSITAAMQAAVAHDERLKGEWK